ncbi:MAG: hypothetical protein HQL91_04030 [Magnetococcales bacterium]|nr:hypothetical protein [Magnetococcales bacterium]
MAEKHADQNWEALRQRTETWIRAFVDSGRHEVLTVTQKRGCARIIEQFVAAMYHHHGRMPEKWTAGAVETCCLETLPAGGTLSESGLLSMPPILMTFFEFLQESGQLGNGAVLIRAVNRAQERFLRQGRGGRRAADRSAAVPFSPAVDGDIQEELRRFADHIAREIAKQRPALISREAMESFERQPILVFDLLQLLAGEFALPERGDDYRIAACFMLLSHALRTIRFGMERRFEWALELAREFQIMVVRQATEEEWSPQFLAGIVESLSEAGMEPTPELLEIYEQQIMQHAPNGELPTRGQIDAMFENLVDEHGGDPFAIGETLSQMIRALPSEAQSALIGEFACSTLPGMRDAVVILSLHGEAGVRHEALQWLLRNARQLSPTALRRLIVMRNWLPEAERKILDSLIKAARIKGVECARWGEGLSVKGVRSSRLDGVGALSLLLSMGVKPGQARIGGLLLKQGVGIADAWLTPVIPRSEAAATLRQVARQEFFLDVSLDFLHAAIRHHLAVGLEAGHPPAVGLLQLAESMVATDWVPERLDGRALVERLIAGQAELAADDALIERIVQTSDSWPEMDRITDSWFEESQEVVDFMANTRMRGRERLVRRILELFCEPNREIWAERCGWTAFWLHEQRGGSRPLEGLVFHFAVLARELYRGRPLHELPLMRGIAERTMGQ